MSRRRNRNRGGEGVARPPVPSDLHGQMAEVLNRLEESPLSETMPDSVAQSSNDSESESNPNSQSQSETPQPPAYWDEEGKALFQTLPAAAQRKIAELDGARYKEISTHLQGLTDEQHQLVEQLGQLLATAPLTDPVVREGLETDWESLSKSDPAAYAAKHSDFKSRTEALTRAAQFHKEMTDKQRHHQRLAVQARLGEVLPSWRDQAERQKLQAELGQHLSKWGYGEGDLAEVRDHRLVLMALDAMKYHQGQTDPKQIAAKKLVHLPRVMATAGLPPESPQARLSSKKQAALQSGSLRQQADYILSLLSKE
ncbi:MAG: hypothetical protein ORO03_03460 [Alphaproteobacteria bacterium]|nr:hypothetical protein [Alphaproteobacteria bacterium]